MKEKRKLSTVEQEGRFSADQLPPRIVARISEGDYRRESHVERPIHFASDEPRLRVIWPYANASLWRCAGAMLYRRMRMPSPRCAVQLLESPNHNRKGTI